MCFVEVNEKHNKVDGKISRKRSTWDVPKDTDMRYDKSGDLQLSTMCGNIHAYESSGTNTDTRGLG